MNRTFSNEDNRKTKLFEAWIRYLTEIHSKFEAGDCEEIYKGSAYVSCVSKNRLGLHLSDGRKLRNIPITAEISALTCGLDVMIVAVGLRGGKWWPLDVISIGSVFPGQLQKAHITFNPLYVNAHAHSSTIQ